MKKYGGIVLFAAVFLIVAMGFYASDAKAAEKNITLYNGSSDANDWEDGDIYHVGDYGKIELSVEERRLLRQEAGMPPEMNVSLPPMSCLPLAICQKPDCRQQRSKCIRWAGIMMTKD